MQSEGSEHIMTDLISSQASVHPSAKIADSVEIGPHCVVGPNVQIEAGTRLIANVVVRGHVTIGRYNTIHPGTVIGGEPQDVSYRNEPTTVTIGDHNIFRECVTINRGTVKDLANTSIGSHCYLMACAHVAHDCRVGSHVIMANGTMLGGHCQVHEHASLSGAVAVHHFVTIGSYAFVGGMSRVLQDVPPFMLNEGQPAKPRCVNIVALKRNEFSKESIKALTEAHRLLFRARVGLDHAREILRSESKLLPEVTQLFEFLQRQHEGKFGRSRQVRRMAA